jgi:hypothetical protein
MELIGEWALVNIVQGDLLRRLFALLAENDLMDAFLLLAGSRLGYCGQVLQIYLGLY